MPKDRTESADLGKTLTSDDILGKDVIGADGAFIGIIEKIHLDPQSLEFIGISIDKGFLKKGLALGRDYISKVTPHAVFLTINPALNLRGMTVFDAEGRKLGKISEVRLYGAKNRLRGVMVRPAPLRKAFFLPASVVGTVGYNLVLNKKASELEALNKEG